MHYCIHYACIGDGMSKQYTIRGVEKDLDRAVREAAATYGVSVNKAALALLRKATGLDKSIPQRQGPPYHDVDDLAGSLGADESEKLLRDLGQARRIDANLWKKS
jgi:hypothetical protein